MIWLLACTTGTEPTDTHDTVVEETCLDPVEISVPETPGLSLTGTPSGDLSCAGDWFETCPDPALQVPATVSIQMVDFEVGEDLEGSVASEDASAETEGTGPAALELTACASTDLVLSPVDTEWTTRHENLQLDGGPVSLAAVSDSLVNVLYALNGVAISGQKGMVTGTVRDCAGAPVSGVQVVARQDTTVVDSTYFREAFPNRDQASTSGDGLFATLNVPEGQVMIEAWGQSVGGDPVLVARSPVYVTPRQAVMVDLFPGRADGVPVVATCQ